MRNECGADPNSAMELILKKCCYGLRAFQLAAFGTCIVVGLITAVGVPWWDAIGETGYSLLDLLLELPFVRNRAELLTAYAGADKLLSVSWALSLSAGLATCVLGLALLVVPTSIELNSLADAFRLLQIEVYGVLFTPVFDGSRRLSAGDKAQAPNQSHLWPSNVSGRFALMNILRSCPAIQTQLGTNGAIILASIWLAFSGPGGPLTTWAVTFYLGYPILIFAICILAAELLIWFFALGLSVVFNKGDKQ